MDPVLFLSMVCDDFLLSGKSSLSDCIAKTLYLISMDPSSRAKLVKSGIIEVVMCSTCFS